MEDIAQELEGLIDQLGVVGLGTQLSQWVHQLKQGKDSCSQNMDKLQQERRALIETLDDLQTDLVTLEAQYTTTANGHDLISLHDTTDALKNNVTELEQKCLDLETQRTQLEQRLATLKRMGDPDASAETDSAKVAFYTELGIDITTALDNDLVLSIDITRKDGLPSWHNVDIKDKSDLEVATSIWDHLAAQ